MPSILQQLDMHVREGRSGHVASHTGVNLPHLYGRMDGIIGQRAQVKMVCWLWSDLSLMSAGSYVGSESVQAI